MLFTAEHEEPRRSLQKFIAAEINPHVDEWEAAGQLPTHELFKKLGDLGFLGLNKPVEFGGAGLDYSYALMMAEELGGVHSGSVPTAIGVHTDMATPALARFGSDALRREFLAPAISGDVVACVGVSEPGAGSDVAEIKNHRAIGRRRLRDRWRQDVDHQRRSSRLDVPARQHRRRAQTSQQVADLRADENEGRHGRAQARQARHARVRHGADLLRGRAGSEAQPHRRRGQGLRLPDDAIPGRAPVGGGGLPQGARADDRRDDRLCAPAQGLRPLHPRQSDGALQARRIADGDRAPALAGLSRRRGDDRAART